MADAASRGEDGPGLMSWLSPAHTVDIWCLLIALLLTLAYVGRVGQHPRSDTTERVVLGTSLTCALICLLLQLLFCLVLEEIERFCPSAQQTKQ